MIPEEPGAPSSEPSAHLGTSALSRDYSFSNAWSAGYELFKAQYGLLLAVAAINLGAGIADQLVSSFLEAVASPAGIIASWVFQFFVAYPIWAGTLLLVVRLARGQETSIDVCLAGFRHYPQLLLVQLALGLIFLGVAAIPGSVIFMVATAGRGWAFGPVILGIAVAILLLLMLWLSARLLFTLVIVVDDAWDRQGPDQRPLGAWDRASSALRMSWNLTQPVTWSLVGLQVSVSLVAGLTILLLCVGILLLGMPLYFGVIASAYVMLARPLLDGRCRACGYPLDDVRGPICPECGTPR
ncbi:MAG: hypothetical protein AB7K52_13500 [Phycisphaerales bacterium]